MIVTLPAFALNCLASKLSCPLGFAVSLSALVARAAGDEGGAGVPVVAFGVVFGADAAGVDAAGVEAAGVDAAGVDAAGVDGCSPPPELGDAAPLAVPAFAAVPDVITAVETAPRTSTA
ncbi:MAG: hypothetical protein ACHP93_06110, partial [Solirubrobacterales bacterium]